MIPPYLGVHETGSSSVTNTAPNAGIIYGWNGGFNGFMEWNGIPGGGYVNDLPLGNGGEGLLLAAITAAVGGIEATLAKEAVEEIADGAFSLADPSITRAGSSLTNYQTNITATEFQTNLLDNGYDIFSRTDSSTTLSNGTSMYTIYVRTSTDDWGAQFFGADGTSVKYSLGGP